MHPPLLPLQPSSFLVIHRFTLFNFLLLFLILFLLCRGGRGLASLTSSPYASSTSSSATFFLTRHSSSFLSSATSSPSVFSSYEPFFFFGNTSFHPLQFSSPPPNPLPPLQPLWLV